MAKISKSKETDYEKLIKLSKKVSSISELAKISGFSYFRIKQIFADHPDEYEKLKKEFEEKREEERNSIPVYAAKKNVKFSRKKETVEYVVDNSIVKNFEIFNHEIENIKKQENFLVLLLDVVIMEFEKLHQNAGTVEAEGVKKFIKWLILNKDNVKIERTDAGVGDLEERIINFCKNNDATLITGIENSATKEVKHLFLKNVLSQETNSTPNNTDSIRTLARTFYKNGKLTYKPVKNNYKMEYIYSKGVIYKEGIKTLEVGDDVFIAKFNDEEGYFTFSHFQITKIDAKDNCILKKGMKIYKSTDKTRFSDARYISFMKDFVEYMGLN